MARAFLTLPVRNTGEVLFIDGLDERRSGRGDRDTVDTLAVKLIEADPAAVRISCRVADGLGKSDLVSLEPFFEGRGGMVVLALEALTPGERRAVLTHNGMSQREADALLLEAEHRRLTEFLHTAKPPAAAPRGPVGRVARATRRDLFEMATRLMLREENPDRATVGSGLYAGEELRLPAGSALAARLISDMEAISLADQEGTETTPSYRTLPFFEPGKIMAALGRRVFEGGSTPDCEDMIDEFRAVLRSPTSGFSVRGIIVEAAAFGPPLHGSRDDLAGVLRTETLPYLERVYALTALLRLGHDGKTSALDAFWTVFGTDLASLRLRSETIVSLYGDPFGPIDVVRLVDDIVSGADEVDVGVLWNLHSRLPLADLPAILDGTHLPVSDTNAGRRNLWEAAGFFHRALLRVLEAPDSIDPARLFQWLLKRGAATGYCASNGEELRLALRATPSRLQGVLAHFLNSFLPDDWRWLNLTHFREAVFSEVGPDQLIHQMLIAMAAEPAGSARELFFYEAALALSYQAIDSERAFARVYEFGNDRLDLIAVRTRGLSSNVPHLDRIARAPRDAKKKNDPDRLRRDFARAAPAIASGADLNGLLWAARVYLGIFPDVDHAAASEARFIPIFG
jgi:hypothetical protein